MAKVQFSVYVEESLKEALDKEATFQDRSLSYLVAQALEAYLARPSRFLKNKKTGYGLRRPRQILSGASKRQESLLKTAT